MKQHQTLATPTASHYITIRVDTNYFDKQPQQRLRRRKPSTLSSTPGFVERAAGSTGRHARLAISVYQKTSSPDRPKYPIFAARQEHRLVGWLMLSGRPLSPARSEAD
jgi:hypothetical protein